MKKLYTLLLLFFTVAAFSQFTHTITFNATTSITCLEGDTLKLYGTSSGDYVASIYSGTNTIDNINPTMVSSTPFYVGYFIAEENETHITFSEISQGPRNVDLNVLSTTGISNKSKDSKFRSYPNPCKDILTISTDQESSLEILSTEGKFLISQPVTKGQTCIDLTYFPSGIYYLKFENTITKTIKE